MQVRMLVVALDSFLTYYLEVLLRAEASLKHLPDDIRKSFFLKKAFHF